MSELEHYAPPKCYWKKQTSLHKAKPFDFSNSYVIWLGILEHYFAMLTTCPPFRQFVSCFTAYASSPQIPCMRTVKGSLTVIPSRFPFTKQMTSPPDLIRSTLLLIIFLSPIFSTIRLIFSANFPHSHSFQALEYRSQKLEPLLNWELPQSEKFWNGRSLFKSMGQNCPENKDTTSKLLFLV